MEKTIPARALPAAPVPNENPPQRALCGRGMLIFWERRERRGAGAPGAACVGAAAAGALKPRPFTVMPSAENLPALASPTPRTRWMKSFQSLNAPCLRSSMILPDRPGPMPLMPSSSATVAWFTSTAANAAAAYSMATRVSIFFSMDKLLMDDAARCSRAFIIAMHCGLPALLRVLPPGARGSCPRSGSRGIARNAGGPRSRRPRSGNV